MIEIERKFLVKNNDFKEKASIVFDIKQGYLNSDPNRTVRIRTKTSKSWLTPDGSIDSGIAYITIKGIGNESGLSRFEWESEIPYDDGYKLLELCEGVIEKSRYIVNYDNSIYEVDVFKGDSEGLVIAEIELKSESSDFSKPDWLGDEVTGEVKYYNSSLMKTPYKFFK